MVSRIIHEVTEVMNDHFVNKHIQFPSLIERGKIKKRFAEKAFPGIIGAIDGTHVHILGPQEEEWNYVNRKGRHSINVQIVSCYLYNLKSNCFQFSSFKIADYDLKIWNVNANFAGSVHDSTVFNSSTISTYLKDAYLAGDHTSWLIG